MTVSTANIARCAALFFAVAALSNARADSPEKVVQYEGNGVAVNTFGNCVRTKWDADKDICAQEAPKPAPVVRKPIAQVSPARQLQKEQRTVYFAFNHDEILPEEQKKLDSLAEVLKSDKSVKSASIVGYADRIGSQSYNEKLSQKRAQHVEDYLHSRDFLNTSMAQVRWLGDSAPITQCSSKLKHAELVSCLQKDRRVEVEIEYYSQAPDAAK